MDAEQILNDEIVEAVKKFDSTTRQKIKVHYQIEEEDIKEVSQDAVRSYRWSVFLLELLVTFVVLIIRNMLGIKSD